ncbi:MAG: YgjV family protein [Clostridia bacterium]|jgi:hypothetical protein|nr:YgjV family protein [Clostridia bacterium]MBQ4081852.1 YgjV family protein [Clostridia bacterium]
MTEWIAQGIGIVAMMLNIVSYQQKKQKYIILFQLIGAFLWTANFLMLDAIVGGLLNIVAIARGVLFIKKEEWHATHMGWMVLLSAAAVAVYVCTFAVFDKPFTLMNALIESLPVIGFVALNQGYRLKDAAATRRLALICSSCWLIYNSVNFAIGGMLCEIFSLISIFTAMYRLDRKKA